MASEDIGVRITTRGGRQAAQEARQVATAIGGIGAAAHSASSGMERFASRRVSNAFQSMRYEAYGLGLTIGGIGTLAVRSGLQFNSSMEQNTVAFTQFLGSAQAARTELATLYQIAKTTPFEFADVTLATRKFLAFGFSVKESNALLRTVADTASGLALDQGGIDRMVNAIGQIRSTGTLQGQDLRQLQQLGAVDPAKLAKSLGVTRDEMAEIGKQHIPATKALRALKQQWDHTFGGQSAKQAKTFAGQLSTLRDNFNQTMGAITMPLFNRLRSNVFPALNALTGRLQTIWAGDATGGMKLFMSQRAVQNRLAPLWTAFRRGMHDLNIGKLIADAVAVATPVILHAGALIAGGMLRGLWQFWKNANTWERLAVVALGVFKFASFVARGALMGRAFRIGWGGGVGTLPAPVGAPGIGGRAGRAGRVAGAGRSFGRAAAGATVVGLPFVGADILTNEFTRTPTQSGNPEAVRRRGPRVASGSSWIERHGRVHTIGVPNLPPIHMHVNVDGKQVAHAVHRHAKDADVRRRGG